MLRWLLPLVTVVALLGQAVTAYAAAGVIGEASCCCPKPSKCKCDHAGKPQGTPEMKRCSGEAKLVAPAPTIALVPAPIGRACEPRAIALAPPLVEPLLDDVSRVPEKPPF